MSDPAGIPALLDAIRHLHGCEARHLATDHVHEVAPTGETVWDGDVEVFEVVGHPQASRCYAWSGADTRRQAPLLRSAARGAVDSAARAVQGSILVDVQRVKRN